MTRPRTHPGEVLREEFLAPLGLSASALARHIDVPANRITEIVRERRHITADTAHRFARIFDTTPQFWLNLQDAYDLSREEASHDYSSIRRYSAAFRSGDPVITG